MNRQPDIDLPTLRHERPHAQKDAITKAIPVYTILLGKGNIVP